MSFNFSFNKPAAPAAGTATSSLFGAQPAAGSSGGSSLFGQPANTGTAPPAPGAPAPFSFGTQQQQPGAGSSTTGASLFGAKPAAPAAGSFGFGSTNNNAQPQANQGTAGSSLFGAPAQAGQTGTGLFGQNQQTQQNQQNAGAAPSLFGQTSTTGQPATGGMFGQSSTTGQNTGGMFGQAGQTQQAGSSLFGGQAQNQNQNQAATGSLFGKPAQTTFGQPGQTSLFGSTAQPAAGTSGAAPAPTGGFSFGLGSTSTQANPQRQPFGQFGQQSQSQPQPQIGQQQQGQAQEGPFKKGDKFSDLAADHQNALVQMQERISAQKQIGTSLNTVGLEDAVRQIDRQVRDVSLQHASLNSTLSSLATNISALESRLRSDGRDLQHFVEIIDVMLFQPPHSGAGTSGALALNTSQNQQGGVGMGMGMGAGMGVGVGVGVGGGTAVNDTRTGVARLSAAHREWPLGYFCQRAEEMRGRVERYRASIAELHRVIDGLGRESEGVSAQAIAQTINNHQNAIINLAAHIERIEMRMDTLRDRVRDWYHAELRTMRDPFDVAREEAGRPPRAASLVQSTLGQSVLRT